MIIVFSTYSGDERTFLAQLAEVLGAEVQDSYRKVARPLLICPTKDNRKYDAAIKWSKYLLEEINPFKFKSLFFHFLCFRFASCDM